MRVVEALSKLDSIVANLLRIYDLNPKSKTALDGTVSTLEHPLRDIVLGDKLFALDSALKECAIRTNPLRLTVPISSTYTEYKRISLTHYIRVPREPIEGEVLDIDDGLAYGVLYMAIYFLSVKETEYKQMADEIYRVYNEAYRDMQLEQILGDEEMADTIYVRYSSDGVEFHDSYIGGDTFISFKSGDVGAWSDPIKFVGAMSDGNFTDLHDTPTAYTDMAGKVIAVRATEDGLEFVDSGSGGGATSFTGLSDTPSVFVADKWLKVNTAGDGLELVDAPSGGTTPTGRAKFGTYQQIIDTGTGDLTVDMNNYNSFLIAPDGDANIVFDTFDDGTGEVVKGWAGVTYTFLIMTADSTVTIDTNETYYGDSTIQTAGATLLELYFDGDTWIVAKNQNIADY